MIRLAAAPTVALLVALASCGNEPTRPSPPPRPTPEPYVAEAEVAPPPRPEVELGELPAELPARWPAPPRITREVHVRTEAQLREAVAQPGTRALVHTSFDGRLDVSADDVELVVDADARIEHLLINQAVGRVRVEGGRFGAIELSIPGRFHPPPVRWDPAWRVHDVALVGNVVESDSSAFTLRGQRIAVIDAEARAERYAVWVGDTDDFASEDIIIARSRLSSAGPESTVRLVQVERAIVVGNVLENTRKHDFRVHGRSQLVYFAQNRLLNTGIMIGNMEEDRVAGVWLVDNTLHHRAESLLVVRPERIDRLVATGNRIYSDRWTCFLCEDTPEWWTFDDNLIAGFQEAPSGAPMPALAPSTTEAP